MRTSSGVIADQSLYGNYENAIGQAFAEKLVGTTAGK
jgi:hypothetical protein